jgi:hypothetical protein
MFQYVETRWQIAVFLTIAALLELSAYDRQALPNSRRFALNAAAAASSIIAMKWHLEGVSPLITGLV